ncbi:hypothetical protein QYF36_009224 [Acer negundo]|nr:hypothetical protein QYF36_009224 [Acer negundo]
MNNYKACTVNYIPVNYKPWMFCLVFGRCRCRRRRRFWFEVVEFDLISILELSFLSSQSLTPI